MIAIAHRLTFISGFDKIFDGTIEGKRVKEKPHVMGLRIVKQIALAHKGRFQIKEEGHTVKLVLPLV